MGQGVWLVRSRELWGFVEGLSMWGGFKAEIFVEGGGGAGDRSRGEGLGFRLLMVRMFGW
jgi:hypothetical protein